MRRTVDLAGALVVAISVASPALAQAPAPAAAPAQPQVEMGQARALVEAQRHAVLSSEIAGRIEKLTVEPGESFAAGKILVSFDCDGLEASRDAARAEVRAAEVLLRQNRRLEQLRSIGSAEVELASVKVDAARATARKAEIDVERCAIKAPFAGRLVEKKVQEHEFVAPGTALLEVLSDRDLKVSLIVPSSWLVWLRPGQPFALRIDETGAVLAGEVSLLGARIDAVSQSLKVTGRLTGAPDPAMLPGMSGTASFPAPQIATPSTPPNVKR